MPLIYKTKIPSNVRKCTLKPSYQSLLFPQALMNYWASQQDHNGVLFCILLKKLPEKGVS